MPEPRTSREYGGPPGPTEGTGMTSDEIARLNEELDRARVLRSREASHSPSWAALDDWVEALEDQLAARPSVTPSVERTSPAA